MRGRTLLHICRTVFAACVLYAFALQGFAGFVAQAEGGVGPLCSHENAPADPADGRTTCCLVACMAATAIPVSASATVASPLRSISLVAWRPAPSLDVSVAVAPAFHARGPPSA